MLLVPIGKLAVGQLPQSGLIASIDNPVLDAETANSFSVSGFGDNITTFIIANGGHSISLAIQSGTGDGPYTWDQPDVAAYGVDTIGIPFDTAAWGSKVVTAGDGTDTATSTTVVNPKAGWAVVEVASAVTTVGSIFFGWTGTPVDTDQVYYPTADNTSVAPNGIVLTDKTVGTIIMQFFDSTDGLWKSFTLLLGSPPGGGSGSGTGLTIDPIALNQIALRSIKLNPV